MVAAPNARRKHRRRDREGAVVGDWSSYFLRFLSVNNLAIPAWRTHSCVPRRHSGRRPVSRARAGVEKSLDTARMSACATSVAGIWHGYFVTGTDRKSEEHTSELQSLRHLVC